MPLLDSLIKKWQIKCIIFDLDGTLVNTLDKHILAFQKLFQELKLNYSQKEISKNMGRTPKDILLTLIPELKYHEEKLNYFALKKEEILTNLLDEIPLMKGSIELLNNINTKKLFLALASSTPKFNVDKIINVTKIGQYFNLIITGEDITIGKPNPEIFLKVTEKLNIKPKECVVIGDSTHDVLAARNCSMRIIAVTTGKHNKREISLLKPDYILKSLKELI